MRVAPGQSHPAHRVWEEEPLESESSTCCFGSSKPTFKPEKLSLSEIFKIRNTIESMNWLDQLNLWNQFSQLTDKKLSLGDRFYAWRHDLNKDLLIHEILYEFKSVVSHAIAHGQDLRIGKDLLQDLFSNYAFSTNILDAILSDDNVVRKYLTASKTAADLGLRDTFDRHFMHRLCTRTMNLYHIGKFFEAARNDQTTAQVMHLFNLAPANLSGWVLGMLAVEKDKIENPQKYVRPKSPEPTPEPRTYARDFPKKIERPKSAPNLKEEYEVLLANANVPSEHWQTLRGFRLASLSYHPDKNPDGEAQFKRLMQLAEMLEIKTA